VSKFISLHNHSDHSILDGCAKISEIVARAKALDQDAISITDHGTISGVIQFYEECKKNDIKPILGSEFYVCDSDASLKESTNRKARHLIVLAKNLEGYKDLIWLNNQAAYNYYYNPRVDINIVKQIASKGNLIGMSACIGGIISSEIFQEDSNAGSAKDVQSCRQLLRDNWFQFGCAKAIQWNAAFNGNFYLEVQDEGIPMQSVVIECFRKISEKTKIKVVATSDPHFASPEDAIAHEVIICSQTKKTLSDREEARSRGEDILFSDNTGYYVKGYEDIKDLFLEEEIATSVEIADQIENYEIELSKPKLPTYPIPDGFKDIDTFLWELCQDNLKAMDLDRDEYQERLWYEYEIFRDTKINGVSLNNYFIILWDIIKEVERLGSKAGVGRGSAAGCLISYLLGITRLDPIAYDLSFQRFFNTGRLSEGRVSLPDIDLDVSAEIRGDVIKYLKEKWGENNVIQIATFGTLQPKAAIKEVFRARGIDFEQANVLTKAFPETEIKQDDDASYTIDDALRVSDEFRNAMKDYKAEVELAKKIEGVKKSRGIHAAGVLISSEDINTFLPISYDSRSKTYMCSFEMGDAEKLCVKVDVLGLKLLTMFDLCQAKINKENIEEKKLDIQEEEDIVEEQNEGREEMSEETKEEVKEEVEQSDDVVEEATFEDMVVEYFSSIGFESKIYPWYLKFTGDKEFHIYVENNSKSIFAERDVGLEAFVDFVEEDSKTHFVMTFNKMTDEVYVVFPKNIKSGNKNIKPWGKIVDGKIVKGVPSEED